MDLLRCGAALAAVVCGGAAFGDAAFSEWTAKSAPAYVSGPALPVVSGASVSVTVTPGTVIHPISPWLLSSNAAVWDGDSLLSATTTSTLQRAGISMLRFPGGSTSDEYSWENNYTSLKAAYGVDNSTLNQDWAVNTDEFMTVCRTTGAQPMFTVNFGLARYGSVAEATSLAARWVKYCNVDHNYAVKYWEVGNENFGDWERGTIYPATNGTRLTGAQYGTIFNQFVTAMKAVDPTIKIGAVGVGFDNGDSYSGYFNWMQQMLPVVQDTADFLILHNYFLWLGGTPSQVTPDIVLNNVSQIGDWKTNVDAMITKYTHKHPGDIPYAHTEYNCEQPDKHDMIEMTNALFVASAVGEFARTGWSQAGLWDVYNGWDSSTGGDWGMLAKGAPSIPDATPRPPYYSLALWSKFGDTLVQSASTDASVRVYAGTYGNGGSSLLLINTGTAAKSVSVDPGAAKRDAHANLWQLAGSAYTAQTVSWNGVSGPAAGGGPQNIAAIPPYSLSVGTTGPISVGLAPLSVSLLVLQPSILYGDLDNDGVITNADAVLSARIGAGFQIPTTQQQNVGDVNGDGQSTLTDSALIMQRAGGLIGTFLRG